MVARAGGTLVVTAADEGVRSRVRDIVAALEAGRDVVIATPPRADAKGDARGRSASGSGVDYAGILGDVAGLVVERTAPIGLFLTGGETALAVMGALGVSAFHVRAEIAPGIPIGTIELRRPHGPQRLPVVTKAGGFGEDTIMLEAIRCLRGDYACGDDG